jgi:flagellar biosynthesis protein FlhA
MTAIAATGARGRLLSVGTPLIVLTLLGMMVVPVPPFALDVFFTFNIALSLVVILMAVYTRRPLDFSVFPTVLLVATLLRLALNIASTRVVLLDGHTGTAAAGHVIESFGQFVMGGNFAVGLAVFAILVIINFVVVTKGAGRVSEVSARFTLDAMPGKQMAIDADLNAGLLTQEDAKRRREEVAQEADFYGAMDGASKFVRGDAVAGILILFINIVGGLAIGVISHGLSIGAAASNYVLLTVGDGLVAQIPSLVLSTATAIIVTRASAARDMGEQIAEQLLSSPRAFFTVAGVVGALGLVPGMPSAVFLLLAALLGGAGYAIRHRTSRAAQRPAEPVAPDASDAADKELSWDDVPPVDVVGLELGYRLIPLVEAGGGGTLLARVKGVRRKLSQELGFLVQPVHIRDNLELPPTGYRLTLLGVPIGENEVMPDKDLAINPGRVFGQVPGTPTREPAFGLEAVWTAPSDGEKAQTLGYTVVDAATVIATHLSRVLKEHAHELLGHEEAQSLLDLLARAHPKLAESLVPKSFELPVLLRVLQNLLAEQVSVRDMRSIAEALAQAGPRTQDAEALTAAARAALGRSIVQQIAGGSGELPLIALDPALEQILHKAVTQNGAAIEPGLAARLQQSLRELVERREIEGEPCVLVVSPEIRPWVARWLRSSIRSLHVLAYTEIPDSRPVKVVATVGRTEGEPALPLGLAMSA